jgi:hypothetical protein
MIDQGYCFNGNKWEFPDSPRRGLYSSAAAYAAITGLDTFEPWLKRLEAFDDEFLDEAARAVPVEWYGGGTDELVQLVSTLADRRTLVRRLIEECVRSAPAHFPHCRP